MEEKKRDSERCQALTYTHSTKYNVYYTLKIIEHGMENEKRQAMKWILNLVS